LNGFISKTPADLKILPRDRRFGSQVALKRWWLNSDPIATAFYNALSVTFPRGEAFFIESVRAFREGAPPKLMEEINAFTKQEGVHSREHVAFNKQIVEGGYELSRLEAQVTESLNLTKDRPQILNLAITMALEHYTAIIAQQLITKDAHFKGATKEIRDLWRWHSMEEIEHKGVAYDTWLHATRDWSRWKRWKVKSLMMLLTTQNFWSNRYIAMLDLLRQDGLVGFQIHARILWFALGNPGIVRRLIPAWFMFFTPGFHPWNHDDRHLIKFVEADLARDPPLVDRVTPC
jgi:uncharacterized protein